MTWPDILDLYEDEFSDLLDAAEELEKRLSKAA